MENTRPHQTPAATDAQPYPESRYLTVDGVRLHYLAHVAPGQPLYLAHHFYGSGANFRPVQTQLAVPSVALDRPGFGFSERPKRTRHTKHLYTRRGQALLAWQMLETLYGTEPIVLAGASAGGTHVLEMAAAKPAQVKGIVLIDAAVTGDVGPPGWVRPFLRAPGVSHVGVAVVDRKAHTVTAARVGRSWADPSRVTDETVAPYRLATTMPRYAYGLYHSFVGDMPPDLRAVLANLTAHTLVVSGANDPVIPPRDAKRIAAHIPRATYVEIPDAGHTPHEERPDLLAGVIAEFLVQL